MKKKEYKINEIKSHRIYCRNDGIHEKNTELNFVFLLRNSTFFYDDDDRPKPNNIKIFEIFNNSKRDIMKCTIFIRNNYNIVRWSFCCEENENGIKSIQKPRFLFFFFLTGKNYITWFFGRYIY